MKGTAPLRRVARRAAWDLALLLTCAAVFVPYAVRRHTPSGLWFGDNPYYMLTTESLVKDGDLDLRNQLGEDPNRMRDSIGLGARGEWYSTHPLLMPVCAVPFYVFLGRDGFLAFNVAAVLALVWVLFRTVRTAAKPWAAFTAVVLFTFTTQTMGAVYNFSPDAFSTLVTLAGVYLLLRERPLAGGIFFGLAVLARTPNVILLPAAVPFLLMGRRPWRSLLYFFAGAAPSGAVFLLMNAHMYGGPFTLSYSRVLMLTEKGVVMQDNRGLFGARYLLSGLWGQLADRHHGLFFTNTLALAGLLGLPALFRRSRRTALLVLLPALFLYVFHAFFKLWYVSGEGSNRYLFTAVLLMAVPFALLLEAVEGRAAPPEPVGGGRAS